MMPVRSRVRQKALKRLSCLATRAGRDHLSCTTGVETPHLARKPNYDFEKRKKEMDRKAKKDAKREDRLQRQRSEAPEEPAAPAADDAEEPGFSPPTR